MSSCVLNMCYKVNIKLVYSKVIFLVHGGHLVGSRRGLGRTELRMASREGVRVKSHTLEVTTFILLVMVCFTFLFKKLCSPVVDGLVSYVVYLFLVICTVT